MHMHGVGMEVLLVAGVKNFYATHGIQWESTKMAFWLRGHGPPVPTPMIRGKGKVHHSCVPSIF